jgi:LmbE family N-acetylglucosaminyl deacetylase
VTIDISDLGTILSVWAHPDDETYLAAGLMSAAADAGQRVVCVSATAGERGTNDPEAWPPQRLARLRRWEAAAAMTVLGVTDHRIVGLPDGGLAGIGADDGMAIAADLLDEIRPDTIVTFGADGITFHPDHIAVSRWVTGAWRDRGQIERLLYATRTVGHLTRFAAYYEGAYMTDDRLTGVPDVELALSLDLTGSALDRKLAALAAMASQTRTVASTIDEQTYAAMVADEQFVEAVAESIEPDGTGGWPDSDGSVLAHPSSLTASAGWN